MLVNNFLRYDLIALVIGEFRITLVELRMLLVLSLSRVELDKWFYFEITTSKRSRRCFHRRAGRIHFGECTKNIGVFGRKHWHRFSRFSLPKTRSATFGNSPIKKRRIRIEIIYEICLEFFFHRSNHDSMVVILKWNE